MTSNLCGPMHPTVQGHALSLEREGNPVTRDIVVSRPGAELVSYEPSRFPGSAKIESNETGCRPEEAAPLSGCATHGIVASRRAERSSAPPWAILDSMASSSPASDAASGVASPSGVSAFVARVLDQLMLSAWLPAALLTASVAVLLQFRSAKSVNVLDAVRALTSNPVRVLVLVIPTLVIATVATQAFSFEAIRTLEGYWHRRGPASLARTLMIRRHVRKKEAIGKRKQKAYEQAFFAVRNQMIDAGVSFNILNAIEAGMRNKAIPPLKKSELAQLADIDWRLSCDAWRLAKIDNLINAELAYPITSRVLPTRLGNLIRATEDQLNNTDGDVQGFALQWYDKVPQGVQVEHDQFRNRLDMYCILVFVSGSLAALTPALLVGRGIALAAIAIICAGFAVLSVASYLAALASASGYCAALRQMSQISLASEKGETVP